MTQNVSSETELTVGAMTHPGWERTVNEDSLGLPKGIPQATLARKGHLYIVADGIGGHQAGDVASQMAVEIIRRTYYEDPDPDIAASLQRAVAAANAEIYRQAQDPAYARMGATLVAAVVRGDELIVANAGDSRAYLLRGGTLQQLTSDHTWVAELVAAGILTPEEAAHHDMRHIVTRSLGAESTVEADVRPYRLLPGDRLLLCSDGVWEPVAETEKTRLLRHGKPQATAAALVNQAVAAGGADDATALVVRAGPAHAGLLAQVGQVVETVLASPQQRAVLGGIGAVMILALLCGLGWRLVGGMQAVAPPPPTVLPTVTPMPTPMFTPSVTAPVVTPTAEVESTVVPSPTPLPPSPTSMPSSLSDSCVYALDLPAGEARAFAHPNYRANYIVLRHGTPVHFLDVTENGPADRYNTWLPFAKIRYEGGNWWVLKNRLGEWRDDQCVQKQW